MPLSNSKLEFDVVMSHSDLYEDLILRTSSKIEDFMGKASIATKLALN